MSDEVSHLSGPSEWHKYCSVSLYPTAKIHFFSFLTQSPHKPSHDGVATEVMQAVRPADLSEKDATPYGHASVLLSVSQCVACCSSRASRSRGAPWVAELWQGAVAGGDGKSACLGH